MNVHYRGFGFVPVRDTSDYRRCPQCLGVIPEDMTLASVYCSKRCRLRALYARRKEKREQTTQTTREATTEGSRRGATQREPTRPAGSSGVPVY